MLAINPQASTVEGDPCWPDLRSAPGPIDAVVIATRPERAAVTVGECIELGIGRVWMHRSLDGGSVSPEVVGLPHDVAVSD